MNSESPTASAATPSQTPSSADLAWGAFSDHGPWVLDPDDVAWKAGNECRRDQVRAAVPRLTKRRLLPPGRRVVNIAAGFVWAVAGWKLARKLGKVDEGSPSKAMLSQRLRVASEQLGSTFIKLGQIISSGEGVFPPELVSEFKKCRDQVPAEPYDIVRKIVEEDLAGTIDDLFVSFDRRPLAAASIAQVHRAEIEIDGVPTEVVVKVQRPQIAERVHADIAATAWLAPFLVGRIPVAALANLSLIHI